MAIVMRENKQLTVLDEVVDKYIADGYSQLDPKTGAVIQRPVNDTILYSEHERIVAELKANSESVDVSQYTNKITELEGQLTQFNNFCNNREALLNRAAQLEVTGNVGDDNGEV